mgnify:FL=1
MFILLVFHFQPFAKVMVIQFRSCCSWNYECQVTSIPLLVIVFAESSQLWYVLIKNSQWLRKISIPCCFQLRNCCMDSLHYLVPVIPYWHVVSKSVLRWLYAPPITLLFPLSLQYVIGVRCSLIVCIWVTWKTSYLNDSNFSYYIKWKCTCHT